MKLRYAFLAAALVMAATLPALASEATFDRTLQVSGRVELNVSTGSGNIHITRGSGTQVVIHGRVKSNWHSDADERVREVAAHPPIEQTGNIIRIGARHENLRNISIDYEIQAPANSYLQANSGSGNVTDEGVGENAKMGTGSGNITANGLQGNFSVETGSGNIHAEGNGTGDVKAQTGSGNIDLKGIRGTLRADTGSGNIRAEGSPTGEWKLETGSGSIELWPGSTGLTLDASTGSGTIHADHEMSMQGAFNKHHVIGKINGGGPTVRAQTGSGDIHVH